MARWIWPGIAAALLAFSSAAAFDVQYVYDASGRLIRAIYANGVTIEYRYDAAGNRREILTSRVANRAPVAVNDQASVAGSSSVDIPVLANDSDPDGHPLTVAGVTQPAGGGAASVIGGGTAVRYSAPATAGTRAFNYTISDGQGGSATATVIVSVNVSNTAPIANHDYSTTGIDTSVVIQVLENDTDAEGQTLTVISVGDFSGGSAVIGPGGSYVIFTAPAAAGHYTFSYTISDGAGGMASSTVSVDVSSFELPGGCVPQLDIPCEVY